MYLILQQESVDTIEVLNSIGTKNNSAIYGITEFSDLTRDEFHAQMLMKRKSLKTLRSRASISAFRKIRATDDGLPVSFNWYIVQNDCLLLIIYIYIYSL